MLLLVENRKVDRRKGGQFEKHVSDSKEGSVD